MSKLWFRYEKLREEDLEVKVNVRYENFPCSCSAEISGGKKHDKQ